MSKRILQYRIKGQPPTFLETDEANALVDAVNALNNAVVVPEGAGTLQVSNGGLTLDISQLINDLQSRLAAVEQQQNAYNTLLNQITAAMANATIACNSDGTITLTFPGIATQPLT